MSPIYYSKKSMCSANKVQPSQFESLCYICSIDLQYNIHQLILNNRQSTEGTHNNVGPHQAITINVLTLVMEPQVWFSNHKQ